MRDDGLPGQQERMAIFVTGRYLPAASLRQHCQINPSRPSHHSKKLSPRYRLARPIQLARAGGFIFLSPTSW